MPTFLSSQCAAGCGLAILLIQTLVGQPAAETPAGRDGDSASKKIFRAGAATTNVTPPLGEPIVGGWRPTPAESVHDELRARALCLDDGRTRLAIVLCDNVGIPREVFDAAKRRVQETTGLPPARVMMASTHTHSATSARGGNKMLAFGELNFYQRFLAYRLADAVRLALNNLEPARIGWGSADAPEEAFNRRWFVDPDAEALLRNPFGGHDRVRMNPPRRHPALEKPAGPIDPEISFVSVQSLDGRPIALLANYSLHYVGGVPAGEVSADYFGVFAERIGELLKASEQSGHPPFVGILSNGTSGDINNIDFQGESRRWESYEKMKQVADLIAGKVFAAHREMEFQDWVPLRAAADELKLKTRPVSERQLKWARRIQSQPEDAEPFHARERVYAERLLRHAESPAEISIPLQAFGIGGLGVAAIPFEVFVEIGLELKDESPFDRTFTIELANGSYGYLPTPGQHALGGYETWLGTNLVELQASERIVEMLLKLFGELRGIPQ